MCGMPRSVVECEDEIGVRGSFELGCSQVTSSFYRSLCRGLLAVCNVTHRVFETKKVAVQRDE